MSVNRFIGYFLVLCACATMAFGSSWMNQATAVPEPAAAGIAPPFAPSPFSTPLLLHPHKSILKRVQIALSE